MKAACRSVARADVTAQTLSTTSQDPSLGAVTPFVANSLGIFSNLLTISRMQKEKRKTMCQLHIILPTL